MERWHGFGWYFGKSHFVTKVLPFIQEGLAENARILMWIDHHSSDLLRKVLAASGNGVSPGAIMPFPVAAMTNLQQSSGARGLRRGLLKLVEEARSSGFSQIRAVGQVAYELELTGLSLEEFLRWEATYHQATKGLPMSTLCMYDASLIGQVKDEQLALCHHGSTEHTEEEKQRSGG